MKRYRPYLTTAAAILGVAYVAWLGYLLAQQIRAPLGVREVETLRLQVASTALQAAAIAGQPATGRGDTVFAPSAADMLTSSALDTQSQLNSSDLTPEARVEASRMRAQADLLVRDLTLMSNPDLTPNGADRLHETFLAIARQVSAP